MQVFVSVGTGLNSEQEVFVSAVEAGPRAHGLEPCSIGRNKFSPDAPLKAIIDLMGQCSGAVVLAVERYRFEAGIERYGSDKEKVLRSVSLPTSWNQIEAAIAHDRALPLFVIVDENLRCDGLLEKGNDWFVHSLPMDPAALNSTAFTGLLESWRERVVSGGDAQRAKGNKSADLDLAKMSLIEIAGRARPAELWALLVALASVLAGAFTLGAKFAT